MSINMGESGGLEYADHETQVLYCQNSISQNTDETFERETEIQYDPVSERGLDNDELAELVGFYRVVNVLAKNEQGATQTQVGEVGAEVALGINLTGQEFPNQSNFNNGGEEVLNDDTGSVSKNNYSEPGAIDVSGPIAVKPGAAPTTDSDITAGSQSFNEQRTFFFPDRLGSGPYLDATDDLSLKVEATKENVSAGTLVEVIYILYWDVQEMPEGRASFARP